MVVLIPAHNEEQTIAATIESVLTQQRLADDVVIVPNGCTDATAQIARRYPVTVMELPQLPHRKSEALNAAWNAYAREADIVICMDADTVIPTHAFRDWERELEADRTLGGSSSKFTMLQPGLLPRLQKLEFAVWTDIALRRGDTRVLAGTGCAIRGEACRLLASRDDREGPWTYVSAVEDFELTYRIRQAGWRCHVSPTVRAYTDAMPTLKALRGQRMKWGVGVAEDLLRFGLNRLTWRDWAQQWVAMSNLLVKALLLFVWGFALTHGYRITWVGLVVITVFASVDIYRAWVTVPHRDWKDVAIAAAFVPNEVLGWIRAWWFAQIWASLLWTKLTGTTVDRWEAQYSAERAGRR